MRHGRLVATRRRGTIAVLAFVAALSMSVGAQQKAQGPQALFERARLLEENSKTLNEAIAAYKQVAAQAGPNRALAAQALLRAAECYQKLGDEQARATFDKVVREYADQREVVAEAQTRVRAMAAERVGTGSFPIIEALHPDGKQIAATQRLTSSPTEVWIDPDLLSSSVPSASRAVGSVSGIYVTPFDAAAGKVRGPAVRIDAGSGDATCAPSWLPDGKSVAFKRQSPPAQGGVRALRSVSRSLETAKEEPWPTEGVVLGGGCWSAPIWFRDGKSFLDVSVAGTNGQVRRAELGTSQRTNLQLPPQSAVALSVDGKTLYLTDHDQKEQRTSIVSMNLASGDQKTLWVSPFAVDTLGLIPLRLAISPDGRTLALVLTGAGKSHLVRVGIDGSGYRDLYSAEGPGPDGAVLSRSGLEWTNDGRSILFIQADKNGLRLLRIAADGGRPEFAGLAIGDSAAHLPAMFDVSPDGRSIVFYSPNAPTIATVGAP